MKKSNWIVYGVMLAASIVALWLWYALGFYLIDSPTDLVISIVWWAVIAGSIFLVHRVEQSRKECVRTMYIGDQYFFNSETGVKQYVGPEQLVAMMDKTLQELKYDFTKQDAPALDRQPVRLMVRTSDYKDSEWKGEVVLAGDEAKQPFSGKEQLSSIINQVKACS